MERLPETSLRIGDWCVDAKSGQISRNGESARLDGRTMRLLLCLAEHAGEVVSIDDLLKQVWSDVNVSPDSVYQAVTTLRRLLGDDAKQPAYIATVPRLGYRMVANVSQRSSESEGSSYATQRQWTFRPAVLVWAAAALCLALLLVSQFRGRIPRSSASTAIGSQRQKTIAVLPFLDLTEGMKEEEFADGITEELIDKLSKIPSLRVPSPTSSFYFKGKQLPVADIARTMGVTYILDGSVRKSGGRVRVAARLMRAENGYVVWSETYDRPFGDILKLQDDIANAVTKALMTSIAARSGHSLTPIFHYASF